jgi:hypothetical protein
VQDVDLYLKHLYNFFFNNFVKNDYIIIGGILIGGTKFMFVLPAKRFFNADWQLPLDKNIIRVIITRIKIIIETHNDIIFINLYNI